MLDRLTHINNLVLFCADVSAPAAPVGCAAPRDQGVASAVVGEFAIYSFTLNDGALICLLARGLVDRSAAQLRELTATRMSPSYPPVGGSTASLGMSMLPLRDVMARLGSILSPLFGLP